MGTDHMVTAVEAAELAGISLQTFRGWKKRGLIQERSVTRNEGGAFLLLYDPHEVLEVERETRYRDPAQQRARRDKDKDKA